MKIYYTRLMILKIQNLISNKTPLQQVCRLEIHKLWSVQQQNKKQTKEIEIIIFETENFNGKRLIQFFHILLKIIHSQCKKFKIINITANQKQSSSMSNFYDNTRMSRFLDENSIKIRIIRSIFSKIFNSIDHSIYCLLTRSAKISSKFDQISQKALKTRSKIRLRHLNHQPFSTKCFSSHFHLKKLREKILNSKSFQSSQKVCN